MLDSVKVGDLVRDMEGYKYIVLEVFEEMDSYNFDKPQTRCRLEVVCTPKADIYRLSVGEYVWLLAGWLYSIDRVLDSDKFFS